MKSTFQTDDRRASAAPYRNLQQYVLDRLGTLIVRGDVEAGNVLPTEVQLAEQFGVSKTVVREAVRGLAAKGLVEVRPRVGTRVRERLEWHILDPDVLEWELRTVPPELLLRDSHEFRNAIEPAAARAAAERCRTGHVEMLEAAITKMRSSAETGGDYLTADLAFHAAVLEASENRMFSGVRSAIFSAITVRHRTLLPAAKIDMVDATHQHEAILDAIQLQDGAGAEAAMLSLLLHSKQDEQLLEKS